MMQLGHRQRGTGQLFLHLCPDKLAGADCQMEIVVCSACKTHLLTMVYEGIYQTRHSEHPANNCADTGNKVCKRLVLFSVLNLHADK